MEPMLDIDVFDGWWRSVLFCKASSLMRARSNGRGGKITSGALPDAWLCRLVDL